MKTGFLFSKITLAAFFSLTVSVALSQTAGSLTFSCNTTAPSGSWGNKHALAIWIENTQTPSVFIKTKAKYGNDDDHLTSWSAKSGRNLVDAVTGATLGSYEVRSIIWDGTDVSKKVVPDGTYNVFIEMGWGKDKVAQHAVSSFSFTKSANSVQLTPAGNNNYSNISIKWTPTVTLSQTLENSGIAEVYPNPASGLVKLDVKRAIPQAKIQVENSLGSAVFTKQLEKNFTGILNIDLTAFANGIYFVKIVSPEEKFTYKVMLNK